MANWLMELTKLSKTDKTAKELLAQLKAATTDEEKEKAKQNGKTYIENTKAQTSAPETTESETVPVSTGTPETEEVLGEPEDTKPVDVDIVEDSGPSNMDGKVVDKKYDMSEPAFNPRLAKMGITREEELFKMGIYVRKLTRDEKILIRRSIYQKTKGYRAKTQEIFKKKQAEARAAREADPEYQKYMHERQFVLKIEEALKNHCNVEWMFRNIEGLNVEVMRELLQKPEHVNRFRAQKETFVQNFYKKYGK